ncbi:tRNA-dihydrouridine synthase B [bacterium BMS3Abin03]|nr:tRNA-dihydrouridine synthase B [bacterium BMS3Abin03]
MGHTGEVDWSWIPQIKEVVNIPVILNGGVLSAYDVKKAFDETGADGVMIARGAIGNPWIFLEAKEIMQTGNIQTVIDEEIKIKSSLRHLKLAINVKGEKRAVLEHRKFYTGYLKGLYNASKIRAELMKYTEYSGVEETLLKYLEFLRKHKEASYKL